MADGGVQQEGKEKQTIGQKETQAATRRKTARA
jgi:hypothetical protein